MTSLFSHLLLSAPNGGGLFAILNGRVFKLDDLDTTGLSVQGNRLLRGLQPDRFRAYGSRQLDLQSLGLEIDDIHDVMEHAGDLYIVGTTKNTVVKLSSEGVVIERWRLPGEDDSCHVNCLTLWNGRVVFTSFGEFSGHRGYKGLTRGAGCVHDLLTGKPIIRGLSQPHSPTPVSDSLLVANSEAHELCEFRADGALVRSKNLGGYTRGICVVGSTIFVGLSSRRDDAQSEKVSKVVALDSTSWTELGTLCVSTPEIYEIAPMSPDILPALIEVCSDFCEMSRTERSRQIEQLSQARQEGDDLRKMMDEQVSLASAPIRASEQRQEELQRELAVARLELEFARRGFWERVACLIRRFKRADRKPYKESCS